jgi:hypothetical protein
LYHGDLCVAPDLHAAVERERLRARYLSLQAALATYADAARDAVLVSTPPAAVKNGA